MQKLADKLNNEPTANAEKFTNCPFPTLTNLSTEFLGSRRTRSNETVTKAANDHRAWLERWAKLHGLFQHSSGLQYHGNGRVLITLFPGIMVYPAESFSNPDGLLLNKGSQSCEVLVKAQVLLGDQSTRNACCHTSVNGAKRRDT